MLLPYLYKNTIEAGVDEAGRGCLAGPVVAAAVVLDAGFKSVLINDSKKLNEKQRLLCRDEIIKHALCYGVSFVDNQTIDKINILQASFKAMHLAIGQLAMQPQLLLIDGNRFKPYKQVPFECIIKGDGKMLSIAAASILAKTARDEYMQKIDKEFPEYNWIANKGYPTLAHRKKVLEIRACKYHRMSFKVQVSTQGNLFD
jgi:ribonuclease HII